MLFLNISALPTFLKENTKLLEEIGLSKDDKNDMVFYMVFLLVLRGGRIGYMLFYGTEQLVNDPLSLFYIWQGGLSFHGGLVGVIVALLIFCKKKIFLFASNRCCCSGNADWSWNSKNW